MVFKEIGDISKMTKNFALIQLNAITTKKEPISKQDSVKTDPGKKSTSPMKDAALHIRSQSEMDPSKTQDFTPKIFAMEPDEICMDHYMPLHSYTWSGKKGYELLCTQCVFDKNYGFSKCET